MLKKIGKGTVWFLWDNVRSGGIVGVILVLLIGIGMGAYTANELGITNRIDLADVQGQISNLKDQVAKLTPKQPTPPTPPPAVLEKVRFPTGNWFYQVKDCKSVKVWPPNSDHAILDGRMELDTYPSQAVGRFEQSAQGLTFVLHNSTDTDFLVLNATYVDADHIEMSLDADHKALHLYRTEAACLRTLPVVEIPDALTVTTQAPEHPVIHNRHPRQRTLKTWPAYDDDE